MIKLLIMDVDGTLTDGKLYIGPTGEVFKSFNIKDGYGIKQILPSLLIKPIIITGRASKIVENRCMELHIIDIFQGVDDKVNKLFEVMAENQVTYEQVAYIGDDDNDLECMKEIKAGGGLVACPSDATPNVLKIADYVSIKCGGDGAVRDFIDHISRLEKRGNND